MGEGLRFKHIPPPPPTPRKFDQATLCLWSRPAQGAGQAIGGQCAQQQGPPPDGCRLDLGTSYMWQSSL